MLTDEGMATLEDEIRQTISDLDQWRKIYHLLSEIVTDDGIRTVAQMQTGATVTEDEVKSWGTPAPSPHTGPRPFKVDGHEYLTVESSKGYKICDNREFKFKNGYTRILLQMCRAEDIGKNDTMLVWQDTREIYDRHFDGCLACAVFPDLEVSCVQESAAN